MAARTRGACADYSHTAGFWRGPPLRSPILVWNVGGVFFLRKVKKKYYLKKLNALIISYPVAV
jgi:hypothetical protein